MNIDSTTMRHLCHFTGGRDLGKELGEAAVLGTLGRGYPTYAWLLANPVFEAAMGYRYRHRN